jgi:radical SAM-linked protein
MRIRIHFAKTVAMRFTGHLDLYRTWEYTLRRANLPLAYSQGFNPHPKINLAAALPLGFTGQDEILDTWLKTRLPVETILAALDKTVPPGIKIQMVQEIDDRAPTLQSLIQASEYQITFLEPFPKLEERIAELLSAPSVMRERREKTYDLRPLILELQGLPDDPLGRARLYARLAIQAGATGRPDEVAAALGFPPLAINAHRTGLVFQTPATT